MSMSMTENDWKHKVKSCFQSFSVILILVVTFTVVIFSQIQSKKRNVYIFGHLTRSFLVIFIRSSLQSSPTLQSSNVKLDKLVQKNIYINIGITACKDEPF